MLWKRASLLIHTERRQAAGHGFIRDLETWTEVIGSRPEANLYRAGLREYQFALLALVQGQYRQAFMALRLSLELLLGGVFLSANELELRVWLSGRSDMVWNSLNHEETGVLSKRFIGPFFESLAERASTYQALTRAVYRECSEYVHGSATTYNRLPESIAFDSGAFVDWHEKAKSVRLIVHFALSSRYLLFLEKPHRSMLEPILLDNLGHIADIREVFGASVEPTNA
jgi:hypothetical protein